jgi:hypothetical protein
MAAWAITASATPPPSREADAVSKPILRPASDGITGALLKTGG